LHFIERSPEVSGPDGLVNRAAFVADDVSEIAAFERQQETQALIAKIRVGRMYSGGFTYSVLDAAVARGWSPRYTISASSQARLRSMNYRQRVGRL
jgi:hypothetical protein